MERKKRWYWILLFILTLGFFLYPERKEHDMKLVHVASGFVVVEFRDEKTTFYDPLIEAEIEERGILVPPFMRSQFSGKDVVLLEDSDFPRAFKEIYYPFTLDEKAYQWKKR